MGTPGTGEPQHAARRAHEAPALQLLRSLPRAGTRESLSYPGHGPCSPARPPPGTLARLPLGPRLPGPLALPCTRPGPGLSRSADPRSPAPCSLRRPPPAGRGPRRAAQKAYGKGEKGGGNWGESLPRPAARALASPPAAAAPPLAPGPGPLARRAPGALRTLAARLRRRNHGGGAAEAAAATSPLPRPGTPPPQPPPPSSASSPPEAPRDSRSPGPGPGARAPNLAALAARRARPALTHRR